MSDVVEDMLGRKFDVEQDKSGNEVWRSQEYPEFTFIPLTEKHANEDGYYILEPWRFSSSTCYYEDAIDRIFGSASRGKSSNFTGDTSEILDIMPVMKQMFVPLLNNEVIAGTSSKGLSSKVFICNATLGQTTDGCISVATYNTGRGALTKYWGEDVYGLAPGCLMEKERSDAISLRDCEFYKKLTTVNTPLEKVSLVMETLNQKPYLGNPTGYKQYQEYQKIFTENAQLIMKDSPEQAQKLLDDFLSIARPGYAFENKKAVEQFFSNVVKYAPDVYLANISKIMPKYDEYDVMSRCKEIYEGGGKYAPQALDCLLSIDTDRIIPKARLLYEIAEQKIPNQDKAKIAEFLLSKEHIKEHINQLLPYSYEVRDRYEKILVSFCEKFSEDSKSLSPKFCEGVFYIAEKFGYEDGFWHHNRELTPVFERIFDNDLSLYKQNVDVFIKAGNFEYFSQKVALKDLSMIPSLESISRENFDAFAKIYEDEYKKASYGIDENNLKQKNVVLEKENNEIMDTIKNKILEDSVAKPVQSWLVKNAKNYPNLVGEILKEEELPYVEMCIKNIENPEKENIACVLNRLQVKAGRGYEDFREQCEEKGIKYTWEEFEKKSIKSMTFADIQEAVDFARRQEICWRACNAFAKDVQKEVGDVALSSSSMPLLFGARMGANKVDTRLTYDMAEAGIDDFKTAKRVAKLFYALNERPAVYGSDYNLYYPQALLPIAKSDVMQDWMYPVMMDAIKKGGLTMSEGRMPSERTLFDCCKAWKINPAMPQRLAKFVGTHSLKGRMLAGAIFDKMVTDGKTTPEEWRDNKVLHEKFYEELARAEKMPREKALKQYIPNTPVNRKRMVGMGMEEKGIENTPENFKSLYRQMREQGVFEKMLAKPEEARTTFSSRLLVETARRRAGRE